MHWEYCWQILADLIVKNWLHNQAWQQTESLQAALADSDWQTWCKATESPLYILLDSLNTQGLNIALEAANFEQPKLQTWLKELLEGKPNKLLSQLNLAWENAKNKAEIVARLLTALENYNFQGNFQKISFIKFSTYHQALAMVILGDAPKKIEFAIQNWLEKQAKIDQTTPVLDTIHALKHRLNRAVSIYQPKHPDLGKTVHNWSKVLLQENLQDSENIENLWQILERSRIGLAGLTMKLPDNWDINLGKTLWYGLRKSIDELGGNNPPSENEAWPLLQIWLSQISEWMSYKTPTIDTCKQHLQAKQALLQPFFDPIRQRLRILWLDQTGLSLKDLPDNCAKQELWLEKSKDSVINQWTINFEQHKRNTGGISGNNPNWEKVMQTEPVQKLADTLKQWAAQLEQITIIFPAPLAQLPWEILPQLENILVREINLAHWLKSTLTPLYERGDFG